MGFSEGRSWVLGAIEIGAARTATVWVYTGDFVTISMCMRCLLYLVCTEFVVVLRGECIDGIPRPVWVRSHALQSVCYIG